MTPRCMKWMVRERGGVGVQLSVTNLDDLGVFGLEYGFGCEPGALRA